MLISEPLANRLELPAQGASLELETPAGLRRFPVVGVYYDYSSSQGNLLMALPFYQQTWGDLGLTAVQLRLAPGYDPDELARSLQGTLQGTLQGSLPAGQRLVVRSNRNLRSDVLEVFDRTFAITAALQVLAMLVAFIGVLERAALTRAGTPARAGNPAGGGAYDPPGVGIDPVRDRP